MKRIIGLFALVLLPIVILSCSDDIILPPDAPLTGDWAGVIYIIADFNTQSADTTAAFITWTFLEEKYVQKMDSTRSYDNGTSTVDCICNTSGRYSLSDGVRLQQDNSVPAVVWDCQSCNGDFDPIGRFRREFQGDTLVLKQLDQTTFIEIRLGRTE